MTKKAKILIMIVALTAVAVTMPESENYYQTAIDLIAAEHGLHTGDLQLQSGKYRNLMQFKTVQVDLITAQQQHIQAEIQQMPFFDWQLTQYQITN